MCGRLNIHNSPAIAQLMQQLGLPLYPVHRPPRFNIAPTTLLDVLTADNKVIEMVWGIEFGKFRHPNTKTETLQQKPFLQKLLLANRCLVPVNRFYEWPNVKARAKYQHIKTRFCIHTPEDVMFMGGFAKPTPQGELQCNLFTTEPNAQINDFHHRMPVIVPPPLIGHWLTTQNLDELYAMMVAYTHELVIYECDSYVNNARNQGARCMAKRE